MKVVLFCGGLGLRFRNAGFNMPKPLGMVGELPIIDHLMRYYSAHGHDQFVLCVGYGASAIKKYFLRGEAGGDISDAEELELQSLEELTDVRNGWRIQFVDSGIHSNIGMRLLAAKPYMDQDEAFLANYSDALTDLPLNDYIDHSLDFGGIGNFVSVRPKLSFHQIVANENGLVESFRPMSQSNLRINGGFFVFRPEIFDVLEPGEDLVEQPFGRLIERGELKSYGYDGFWQCMDTFKDKQLLENLQNAGDPPWEFWKHSVQRLNLHAT